MVSIVRLSTRLFGKRRQRASFLIYWHILHVVAPNNGVLPLVVKAGLAFAAFIELLTYSSLPLFDFIYNKLIGCLGLKAHFHKRPSIASSKFPRYLLLAIKAAIIQAIEHAYFQTFGTPVNIRWGQAQRIGSSYHTRLALTLGYFLRRRCKTCIVRREIHHLARSTG